MTAPLVGILGGGARLFGDADEGTFAFHYRQDAALAIAMHGVSLPVAKPQALRDAHWPLAHHRLAGEPPTTIPAAVALASLLA